MFASSSESIGGCHSAALLRASRACDGCAVSKSTDDIFRLLMDVEFGRSTIIFGVCKSRGELRSGSPAGCLHNYVAGLGSWYRGVDDLGSGPDECESQPALMKSKYAYRQLTASTPASLAFRREFSSKIRNDCCDSTMCAKKGNLG